MSRYSWRDPGEYEALRALRARVVRREVTIAQAAASVGLPRGTLCGRWRSSGLDLDMPIVHLTPTAERVRAIIERHPELSDYAVADRLGVSRSTVHKHRQRGGIPSRDDRMRGIDRNYGRPYDEDLKAARDRVVARTATVRGVADELRMCASSLYRHWHRLGLVGGKPPRGIVHRRPRRCRVREEVRAHTAEYPWMRPDDIANSMTADGYPISVRAVEWHLENIRKEGSVKE